MFKYMYLSTFSKKRKGYYMKINKKILTYIFFIFSLSFIPSKANAFNFDFFNSVIDIIKKDDSLNPVNKQNSPLFIEHKNYKDDESYFEEKGKKTSIDEEIDDILNQPEIDFLKTENILTLLPKEVDLLVSIDFQKFFRQDKSKKLLKKWLKNRVYLLNYYKEIKEKFGFDFFRDINDIYLFAANKIDQNEGILNGILVVGKFDKEKFLKSAKESSKLNLDHYFSNIDGYDVLCPRYGKEGYAILVDDRYLVMGSKLGVNSLKNIITGRQIGRNQCLSKVIEEQDKDTSNKPFIKIVGECSNANKNQSFSSSNFFILKDVEYFYADFGYNFYQDHCFEACEANYFLKVYDDKDSKLIDSIITSFIYNYRESYLKKELPFESFHALTQSEYGGFRNHTYSPMFIGKKLHYSFTYSFKEMEEIYNGFLIMERKIRERGY